MKKAEEYSNYVVLATCFVLTKDVHGIVSTARVESVAFAGEVAVRGSAVLGVVLVFRAAPALASVLQAEERRAAAGGPAGLTGAKKE